MTVPVTLAILGASGDLAHRLLLPGLGTLLNTNPEYDVTLVGAAVDDLSQEEWVSRVKGALGGKCPRTSVERVIATTRYEQRIVAPVLNAWRDGLVPMDEYIAGGAGPSNWKA